MSCWTVKLEVNGGPVGRRRAVCFLMLRVARARRTCFWSDEKIVLMSVLSCSCRFFWRMLESGTLTFLP